MHVLFLTATAVLGGTERCLLDMVTSLKAAAPEVDISVAFGDQGPLVDAVAEAGARTIDLALPSEFAALGESQLRGAAAALGVARAAGQAAIPLAGYLLRVRSRLHAARPDIIHTTGVKTHLLGALARPRDARLVLQLNDFGSTRRLTAPLMRGLRTRAHLAIGVSRAVTEDARSFLPGLPIETVYNAIDVERFAPTGPSAPLAPPPRPESVKIGMLGAYARWKGQDVFLRAAREVLAAPDRPDVHFYVVGGPIYRTARSQFSREELEALAVELGIMGSTTFVPFHPRPEEVLRALDVVAHTSTMPEPFGRTIVEAMATGRALVATATGGAGELIQDEVDALAVPPGDPHALATALLRLVRSPEERRRLGERARADAVVRFSRERLGPELLALYGALLRKP